MPVLLQYVWAMMAKKRANLSFNHDKKTFVTFDS